MDNGTHVQVHDRASPYDSFVGRVLATATNGEVLVQLDLVGYPVVFSGDVLELDKVGTLRARFPTLGISVGYIGSTYGSPNTPAYRDDRSYRVMTNLKDAQGHSISIELDSMTGFDVEEVSLRLQNIVVHRARVVAGTLSKCPCSACVSARLRRISRNSR